MLGNINIEGCKGEQEMGKAHDRFTSYRIILQERMVRDEFFDNILLLKNPYLQTFLILFEHFFRTTTFSSATGVDKISFINKFGRINNSVSRE